MDKNNTSTTASVDGFSSNAVTSASAAIATIPDDRGSNDDNFEDDLEEGEIADDDDNDIDDDFANNNNNTKSNNNSNNSTNTYADGDSIANSNNTNINNNNNPSNTGGKKKVVKRVKKKVVKRVKKKVKVKKKKPLAGNNEGTNKETVTDTTQALRVNSTLSVVGQNRTFSVQNSNISFTHNPMMHMPRYGPLLPKRQDPSLEEQEKQRLLCEQQIKMLQAQQQNAPVVTDDVDYKLIIASAMDEDLRILPYLFNPIQPTHVVSQPFPNIAPTTPTTPPTKPTTSKTDSTRTSSSYDAINKMLNMLRQSTQETNEGTLNDESGSPPPNPLDPRAKKTTSRHPSESISKLDLVSYRLVPITIDSIDYSEYRRLALTDQKLKNDPRLNRLQDYIIG